MSEDYVQIQLHTTVQWLDGDSRLTKLIQLSLTRYLTEIYNFYILNPREISECYSRQLKCFCKSWQYTGFIDSSYTKKYSKYWLEHNRMIFLCRYMMTYVEFDLRRMLSIYECRNMQIELHGRQPYEFYILCQIMFQRFRGFIFILC